MSAEDARRVADEAARPARDLPPRTPRQATAWEGAIAHCYGASTPGRWHLPRAALQPPPPPGKDALVAPPQPPRNGRCGPDGQRFEDTVPLCNPVLSLSYVVIGTVHVLHGVSACRPPWHGRRGPAC